MVRVAVLQLVSQALEICFVEVRNLYFGELYFPFIVLDYLFYFMFELEVVFLDELQSMLLTRPELLVYF